MPEFVRLTHESVTGIDKTWEEVNNLPFGGKIVWNPDYRCSDCGRGDFVMTSRPTFIEEADEAGKPIKDEEGNTLKHKGEDKISIVCPRCIDFGKDDSIVADFDHGTMTVTIYDYPRRPTEEELRPGRWRKDRDFIREDYAPKARVKFISGADFLEWQAYVRESEEYRSGYEAAKRRLAEEKEKAKRKRDEKHKSRNGDIFS